MREGTVRTLICMALGLVMGIPIGLIIKENQTEWTQYSPIPGVLCVEKGGNIVCFQRIEPEKKIVWPKAPRHKS